MLMAGIDRGKSISDKLCCELNARHMRVMVFASGGFVYETCCFLGSGHDKLLVETMQFDALDLEKAVCSQLESCGQQRYLFDQTS